MEKSFYNFFKSMKANLPTVNVVKNQTFKNLTTIKIGGKIRAFIEIKEVTKLLKIISICKKNKVDYFVLGNGSNLLASDKIHEKVVLKISLKNIRAKNNLIICGAGVNMFSLNHFAIKNGLSGLEWSYGIPGTVGGGVKMNAGSFGSEMKDIVEYVYYTDGEKIFRKNVKSLDFSYRNSFFSKNNYVILKVVLKLKKDTPENIDNLCTKIFSKRFSSQPYGTLNAGSVFKKPKENYAPVLIEMCGLKGQKYKNAEISEKHCGFIINTNGKATFKQVLKLICKIKKTVFEKFGIMLETEIEILE
ncbi:MAG: UDP-N-acetylmuramate dehydrogenase [Clostridia bacterium]|nr:UDP-N-acetylmuramate dehydrogenase [Clostridia bacterium]